VSGDVPPPGEWVDYPQHIHFDGRPTITYTSEQLDRLTLISASFKSYSSWNGRNELPTYDRVKLKEVIQRVHAQGKLIRFWAIPDNEAAWTELMDLGVDVINTDNVEEAVRFIRH
jgi:alkaline phosphatase